jgi:hypothetical protein
LACVLERRAIVIRLRNECAGGIALAEDNVVAVDYFHGRRQPSLRILEPRLQPRERLLDRADHDGMPFGLVRIEQRRDGAAARHVRQLPRQVVSVLDARVPTECTCRRHQVRGVANEKRAPFAEPVGHTGGDRPRAGVGEIGAHVGLSGALSHQFAARIGIERLGVFPRGIVLQREKPSSVFRAA